MAQPISLAFTRTFVDVPKSIDPVEYSSFLAYIQIVNQRQYHFENEVIIGQKQRVFFGVDRRSFKHVKYEDYLQWKEQDQLDGRNTN
jgi:hypothetical protein